MKASTAAGEGDALVLPVPRPGGGRASERDGHDFGKTQGRGVVFGKGGWSEEKVEHALRADPDLGPSSSSSAAAIAEAAAGKEKDGGNGDTRGVERRKERVARMMARLPRRGRGAPDPTSDGGGHGRVIIA